MKMLYRTIILKEISQRRSQLITSLLAITLGIAVIVGIKNITVFSEKAVSLEMDALGANILILPKSSSVQDYYSADFQDEQIPEAYINSLVNSSLAGIDNLSPKLNLPIQLNGHKLVLTGILPKNEFQSKSVWQGALGIFSRPKGCGTVSVKIPGINDQPQNSIVPSAGCTAMSAKPVNQMQNTTRRRVIEGLAKNSVLAGSDTARLLGLQTGNSIEIMGKRFIVETILPVTGTVDDSRIFAHLHTVQELAGKPGLLNAIEIVGCCSAISKGLIQEINRLLPEAKVVTITQIVQTQIKTNTVMNKLSLIMLIIILIVGGASIANYMFADVYERRREIGILMALGAGPADVAKIFIYKALLIGLCGGIAGYIFGTVLALFLGPKIAGISVMPIPLFAGYSLLLSAGLSIIASIFPVIMAVKMDPFIIMQEE